MPRFDAVNHYQDVRAWTEHLTAPLAPEDLVIQSMPDASPAKWHLAHTSWFFETFVLKPALPGYQSPHPQYDFLFNSYYNAVGERHCRAKRGLISRPTVAETFAYRAHVDREMMRLIEALDSAVWEKFEPIVTLGLHHEQQHQELLLTDIKHVFGENPLLPAYRGRAVGRKTDAPTLTWQNFDEGVREIGWNGDGFAFDNEGPRHKEFVPAFALASRLVTNGEFLAFMADGGYERPEFWLSAGWGAAQAGGWRAPFYWEQRDGQWQQFTLSGLRPVVENEPVCHLSLFEADACAQWAGARLPTEAEWEIASETVPMDGPFVEAEHFHPSAASKTDSLTQMFGDVWQWTRSQYEPYPGYKPAPGALGEYNGKFMCNQFVLRGGSCATPRSHMRRTYRNFFPPDARWQFTGLRLAKDA